MTKSFIRLVIVSLLAIGCLSACGNKGGLYLPERQYPQPNNH